MGLDTVLARSLTAQPDYPDVGATRAAALDGAALPTGWNHLWHSEVVGTGPAALAAAADCILGWGMHRGAGISVTASAPVAAVGVRDRRRPVPAGSPVPGALGG